MNRVVGNQLLRSGALPCLALLSIGLRVQCLVVIDRARQQAGKRNGAIEARRPAVGKRRGKLRLIGFRPVDGFLQRDGNRRGRQRRICLRCLGRRLTGSRESEPGRKNEED